MLKVNKVVFTRCGKISHLQSDISMRIH